MNGESVSCLLFCVALLPSQRCQEACSVRLRACWLAWVWPGDSPRGSAFLALEPPWRPCNGERTHRHFLEALPPALSSGLTMERKSLSLCRKSSQVSLWAPQAELSFTCGEACLGPLLPSSPVPLSGPFLTKWVHG